MCKSEQTAKSSLWWTTCQVISDKDKHEIRLVQTALFKCLNLSVLTQLRCWSSSFKKPVSAQSQWPHLSQRLYLIRPPSSPARPCSFSRFQPKCAADEFIIKCESPHKPFDLKKKLSRLRFIEMKPKCQSSSMWCQSSSLLLYLFRLIMCLFFSGGIGRNMERIVTREFPNCTNV